MIHLYTDGACRGNPGPGSYAFALFKDKKLLLKGGHFKKLTTNNEMELTAILMGLKECSPTEPLILYSDSQYAIHGLTTWRHQWKKNNWLKSDKKPVLNLHLWKEIDLLVSSFSDLTFQWVKGHAESKENEFVDLLANEILDQL